MMIMTHTTAKKTTMVKTVAAAGARVDLTTTKTTTKTKTATTA